MSQGNILIGKVFQASPDAVRQIISTPTLRHAVIMGLNEIAHNRTFAKSGYDLSQELGAAVDLVARAKAEAPDIYKEGMPVSPYGRQAGLFDDEYGDSRVTDATVLLLADVLNSGKPSDLRKMLATYNNEAQAPASGQIDMFSGDVRSKEQLLNDVNEYFRNATPKEQQAIVDAAVAERKQRAEANAQVADGTGRNGNGEPNTEVRNGDDVGDGRQNGSEEAYTDKITPVGESDFGFVYDQFKGNAQGAIQQLMKMQDGEALGALHHTEIGDIDLVWGKAGTRKSDGYGLAKLVKFHPEVLDNLQGILDSMHVTKRSENRVQLENDEYQAAVRLTWNGDEKLWLLTAFKKKETSEPTNSRTDVDSNLDGKSDDTATRQSSDVSANKGIDNQSDLQENNVKTSVNEEGIDWSTREESPRNEAEWMDMMRFEYDGKPVPEEKDMRSMKRFIDNVLSEDRGIDETTSEHTATTERMAEIPATRLYNSEAAWFSHKKYGDSIAFFDEGEKAVYKLSAQRDKRGYIARVILTRETFAKEGKTLSEQKDIAVEGKSYTIEPTTYTNKKDKTTAMHLVKFGHELTKEQKSAGKELAKESRGWWDAKQGGFMMRSEEAAKELAEALGNEEAVQDAQPISVKDMEAVNDNGVGATASKRSEMRKQTLSTIDQAVSMVTGKPTKEVRAERKEREAEYKAETKELYDAVLSGDFNDVTLQRINDYLDHVTPNNEYGRPLSKRLPPEVLRGVRKGERTSEVDVLFSRISESAVPAHERTRPEAKRRIEEKKKELLKGWAIPLVIDTQVLHITPRLLLMTLMGVRQLLLVQLYMQN